MSPTPKPRELPGPRSDGLHHGLRAAVLLGGSLLACRSEVTEPSSAQRELSAPPASSPSPPATPTEDDFARWTERWRDRIADEPEIANDARFETARSELSAVVQGASDIHLRANASLLLGLLYEGRGDGTGAVAQYRHAAKLVPDDAGPHMALALALAAEARYAEAAEVQATAARLDPDNLENWLTLGELLIKSGDKEAGMAAYVSYEQRRKGLIDGLTLRSKAGAYLVGPQERVACAESLALAADEGTAVALTYALKTDPEAQVRAAVASVMGAQRLSVYAPALVAALSGETDAGVRAALAWAAAEIERDPVTPRAKDPAPGALEGTSR